MRDFTGFLREMVYFYDGLDFEYNGRKPENNEIRNKIVMTAKEYGVPIFGEGTNRTVFELNGYVYKLAHKRGATFDNIGEKENSEIIVRNHRELIPHVALANKYIENEYILEEEQITQLFEHPEAEKYSGSDGERALKFLMQHADDYDYLIEMFTRAFIIMDASPKSIFNYGLKTVTDQGRRMTTLANLDYAFFVPKSGWLVCPECDNGELKYDKIDLHTRGNYDEKQIIKTVTAVNEEQYKCTNSGCSLHKRGLSCEDVIDMYEDGRIITEPYANSGYTNTRKNTQGRRDTRYGNAGYSGRFNK